jgi:hypothetical protein
MTLSGFIDPNSKEAKERQAKLTAEFELDNADRASVRARRNPYYQAQHAYYIRNREKLLAQHRNYYHRHRDATLQQKKIYSQRPEVKEHRAKYAKNYYIKNKEELNRKNKERYHTRKNDKIILSQVS